MESLIVEKKKDSFEVPIVLFVFKRLDKTMEVLERISQIKPSKLYILSDEGRNDSEKEIVKELRKQIEEFVNWDCKLVKNYATENRGVYENIGKGALWVLEREENAIFLEDDNLPELSFFKFCNELLVKYKDEESVLWICGTNYLEEYSTKYSYMFTRHMLPCGWASWSHKFLKYYDGELELWEDPNIRKKLKENKDIFKPLLDQYCDNWNRELNRKKRDLRFDSWDYQMALSLKANNLFGIAPKYNQIRNIGVDEHSIHGGSSLELEMTKRFCNLDTREMEFPLIHQEVIAVDEEYEMLISKIILLPLKTRLKGKVAKIIKSILGLNEEDSIKGFLKRKK